MSTPGQNNQLVEELARQNEALRERLSKLSEASLRVNESLDYETVLQGVLDSACSLTDARYGVIAVFDAAGRRLWFSSGMSVEQNQRLMTMEGRAFREIMAESPGPLRLRDLFEYLRSRGLAEFRLPIPVPAVLPFMAAPVRLRGEVVAQFYVGDKQRAEEFSADDEEMLVMFASQAALVIANARRHRDEQRARADLEALVNTAPVGVVVVDASSGLPVSVNHEARRILGELLEPGQPLDRLHESLTVLRADRRPVPLGAFPLAEALGAGKAVRAEEIVLRVGDGRSVTTLVNATPIRSETGEVASYLVTLQDMSPMEELERLRAEFLGMVSHELRTPLTSIIGSASTLLDSSPSLDPVETAQFHRIIHQQAESMRDLIGELLDVARIEAGELSVFPVPVEAASLVDEARNTFLSGGGRNDIQIDIPPDLPLVLADRRRIVQVLGNLLSNAARVSPESSAITVTAAPEDGHVAFCVVDEGRGIPAERLPHLFRKYSRLEGEDRGRGITGSGMGLAICKGIVEAHGGRISADSDGLGRGSRFTFTVPAAEEPASAAPRLASRSRQLEAERPRILVVDDDPQTLSSVRDALSQAGYASIVTGDPSEACDLLEEREPHLVLLDLMLPGTDGIELMGDILAAADVPVIFLSAYGQDEVIARALEAGASDYVVKPFSPTELAARIGVALRSREAPSRVDPLQPYRLGELTIDYASRQVTVGGRAVALTGIEYRLLTELSVNAGRELTYGHLLRRVWSQRASGDARPVRTAVKLLRRKLGDDADSPTYIFTEPRIGYRMARGEPS